MAANDSRPIPELSVEDIERFWKYVDKTPGQGPKGECWTWTGTMRAAGDTYGCFAIKTESYAAHRISYKLLTGDDPVDFVVCHECDFKRCVRCVWKGTHKDNHDDMKRKGRGINGDRNGSRKHPESRPRGDNHYMRQHPEVLPHGDDHWTRKYPGRHQILIRQRKNWDANLALAKTMIAEHASGVSVKTLMTKYKLSQTQTYGVIRGERWNEEEHQMLVTPVDVA